MTLGRRHAYKFRDMQVIDIDSVIECCDFQVAVSTTLGCNDYKLAKSFLSSAQSTFPSSMTIHDPEPIFYRMSGSGGQIGL